MTGYTFVAHPRHNFTGLEEWAQNHGVVTVCGHGFFKRQAAGRAIFTYGSTEVSEHFLMGGNTQFADGYDMQYWVVNGNRVVLGRVGSLPLGRSLEQFMRELPGLGAPHCARAIRVLRTQPPTTEYQFELYTGNLGDLATSTRDLRR